MPATIIYWVLAEGLMAAVLSDTLTQSAPSSTAAELRFCSTRYQVCLNFQLELEPTKWGCCQCTPSAALGSHWQPGWGGPEARGAAKCQCLLVVVVQVQFKPEPKHTRSSQYFKNERVTTLNGRRKPLGLLHPAIPSRAHWNPAQLPSNQQYGAAFISYEVESN